MDIHQKKALGVATVSSTILYISLIILFGLSLCGAIIVAVCGLALAVLLLIVNRWLGQHLNNKVYPNNEWYRKNLERNFDIIILGDDIARGSIEMRPYEDKKIFDLSRQGQNINIDFTVLKNTFSILKPQGEVILPLREASCKYAERGFEDERLYYWALSPYVFNNGKLSCMLKKIYTRIPILMIRWKDIIYIFRNLCSKNMDAQIRERRIKEESKWLQNTPNEESKRLKQILQTRIKEIEDFCQKRELKLKILEVDKK